jgi:hypothetical protein
MHPITDGQAAAIHVPPPTPHPDPSVALAAAQLAEAAALQGPFWPAHELLCHHQKALEIPTCWATPTGSGWTVAAWASTWPAAGCASGSRPMPTAAKKAAPVGPRPCSSTAGGTWPATTRRLWARAGHRNHEAMTMAGCLHLNQRTLAFVSATLGD